MNKDGIANIQMLATDFIIAPTHPPANGPKAPTIGTLINKLKRADLNPNKIQHKTQGTATKSILMNQGVTNIGGKACKITESGAKTAAPAILMVVFSKGAVNEINRVPHTRA